METTAKQHGMTAAGMAKPAGLVCLALMASLPFLQPFHSQPVPSFHTEWLAFVLGLLACLCVVSPRDVALASLLVPRVVLLPCALVGVVLLQLALGKFSYAANAIVMVCYLAWSAAIACTAATLARRLGHTKVIAALSWALFISGILSALCGFVQYAGLQQGFGGWVSEPMDLSHHGIYGNLSQQNHFATHLALAMASGAYLCMRARLKLHLLLPALGLMGAALLLSGSRSALLYLPWLALLALFRARAEGRIRLPQRLGFWLLGAFCAGIAALWLLARVAHVPQLTRLFDFSAAFGPRVFLWQHAWAMFLAHPLSGAGFEGFAAGLIEQIGDSGHANPWGIDPYAHDLPLHLMAVSGVCGLLALAVPAVLFIRRQCTLAMSSERFWIWGSLGMLALHSLLEQPLFYSYFLGLAAILMGLADPAASSHRLNMIRHRAMQIAAAACVMLAFKTWHDYGKLEDAVFGERAAFLDPAIRQATLRDLHSGSLLMPLTELSAPELFATAPATAQSNLAFNERVMHYAPTAEVEFRDAVLLADAGRPDDAMRQFDRAARAYPDYLGEYAERFKALGQMDAQRYGALAAHVQAFQLH